VVLYSGNSWGFYSVDGGRTFSAMNPAVVFGSHEGGFCCDTVIRYSPRVHRFFWLLQGDCSGDCDTVNRNRYVLAVTSAAAIRDAVHAGRPIETAFWTYSGWTQALFGDHQWYDFPDMAVGTNALYMVWDRVGRGTLMTRTPLAQLASDSTLTIAYWKHNGAIFPRVAQQPQTTEYWLTNDDAGDSGALDIYSADDTSPFLIRRVAHHAAVPSFDYTSGLPFGGNWAYRAGFTVGGATIAGDELWVAWNAGRAYPGTGRDAWFQPHVQYAAFSINTLSLIREGNVWDSDQAILFPFLASDAEGDVAMSFSMGGPDNPPGPAVRFLTGYQSWEPVASADRAMPPAGNADRAQGDYSAVQVDGDNPNQFVTAGYVVKNDPSGTRNHWYFARFARGTPNPPPPPVPTRESMTVTCPAAAVVGQGTSISGALTPALSGASITLDYTGPSGTTPIHHVVLTDAAGQFFDPVTIPASGTWSVSAAYAGDSGHTAANSSCAFQAQQPVQVQPTFLTLTCPKSGTPFVGSPMQVSGGLSPILAGATISLTYTRPNATTITHSVTTDSSGRFTDTITPDVSGTWSVSASYGGDTTHEPSSATPCSIFIQNVPQ
jgi:hypothetical protein